jgi:hypothetical protein
LLGGSKTSVQFIGAIWQLIGSKEQDDQRTIQYQHLNHRQFHSAASVTLEENANAMLTKYEDNFGFYRIDNDDSEELEFFVISEHRANQKCACAAIRKYDC